MTLYVFDLDKTLIDGDSNELWHEFIEEKGFVDRAFIEEDKRLMALYAKGELNMDEYLEFALTGLSSLSVSKTQALMDEFLDKKIKPIVYKEVPQLIKEAQHSIIISATPEFVVKNVASMLGIYESIGMRLIEKNGYFTNRYEKPLSYREGKVACLKNWLADKNLKPKHIIFYTDSINDLPLCEFAHEVYCVNPDEKLEKIAKSKKWMIYRW